MVGKKCASACACMHVRVSIRTLNTHLKSAWCWQPYQQQDAAGMLGKETLESRGWDGAAPSCLIPPAKCKHVMAKGRQLLASEHVAPMRRKLLSVWGAECVSMRYGDTTTVVWRYTQLSRSLWLASSWCNSFLLPLLLFLVTLCIVLYLLLRVSFLRWKKEKLCPWLWEKEKDSMSLTPRAYSPRAAVFVNGYSEGMTEFVG